MVELYATKLLQTEEFQQIRELLLTLVPQSSRKRINAFYREPDAQRSLFGELLIRCLLCKKLSIHNADLRIEYEEKGKPYVQNYPIHFNMSHSGSWIVAAFSGHPVGIDVEQVKKCRTGIARRFFNESEFQSLMDTPEPERSEYFYTLWTLKESYLKALGKGLTLPLSSFIIKKTQGEYLVHINGKFADVHLRIIPLEKDYVLAVCAHETEIVPKVKLFPANQFPEALHQI
ncbi:MAG: 4'-phosphopantetheinyl transferase superfamily protein [Bacteroidales bacterium]|nr:4'-phosphopantetheinyl transferase superfamily protein [Lentimicrobiaceae bacterium]MDD5694523.1 4'-phosphopantetheinyl transferase superfamily protein [Bacteroidales bacterium]